LYLLILATKQGLMDLEEGWGGDSDDTYGGGSVAIVALAASALGIQLLILVLRYSCCRHPHPVADGETASVDKLIGPLAMAATCGSPSSSRPFPFQAFCRSVRYRFL
jgi:hypothetical protein